MSWRGIPIVVRRSTWPGVQRATGVGGVVLAIALTLTACGSSSSTLTTTTVANPAGWKTYTFAGAAIAIPPSWDVSHGGSCITWSVPGTLLLPSVTRAGSNCPSNFLIPTVVSIAAYHSAPTADGEKQVVNGIVLYSERIMPGAGDAGGVVWTVPSLGVVINAAGNPSNYSPVIHTLHRA